METGPQKKPYQLMVFSWGAGGKSISNTFHGDQYAPERTGPGTTMVPHRGQHVIGRPVQPIGRDDGGRLASDEPVAQGLDDGAHPVLDAHLGNDL